MELNSVVKRKLLHIVFSLALLIPLTPVYSHTVARIAGCTPHEVIATTYVAIALGAMFFNSLQIRLPSFRENALSIVRDVRKKVVAQLRQASRRGKLVEALAQYLEELDKIFDRAEDRMLNLIREVERDYEKRFGYVAVTFAVASTAFSYILFGTYVMWGILALAIVDGVSAIVTSIVPKPRIAKHSIPSMLATYATFLTLATAVSHDLSKSAVLSLVALVTEMLSPEDNLTLPLIVSAAALLLSMPAPPP